MSYASLRAHCRVSGRGVISGEFDLLGVRRVLLVVSKMYVYYRVNADADRIDVLAVWSTSFGDPPPLDGG
jgi:hypothetical protein